LKEKRRKKRGTEMEKRKPNIKVIIYSLIGLIFVILAFAIDWLFLIGAAIVLWLNQRELMGKRN
tara:strand:+ start:183 stop:374 length:192 start_codon:yes stop_codon:yes gene_type:complete